MPRLSQPEIDPNPKPNPKPNPNPNPNPKMSRTYVGFKHIHLISQNSGKNF